MKKAGGYTMWHVSEMVSQDLLDWYWLRLQASPKMRLDSSF